jgi:hypothetical protein
MRGFEEQRQLAIAAHLRGLNSSQQNLNTMPALQVENTPQQIISGNLPGPSSCAASQVMVSELTTVMTTETIPEYGGLRLCDAYNLLIGDRSWRDSELQLAALDDIGLDSPDSVVYLRQLPMTQLKQLKDGLKPLYWTQLKDYLKLPPDTVTS